MPTADRRILNQLTVWLTQQTASAGPGTDRQHTLIEVTRQLDAFGANAPGRADAVDIQVASILSAKTKQGRVEFVANGERMQMDLDKAREVRDLLSGAIEAAVSDTLIYAFLTQKVGLDPARAGHALLDFRELRQGTRGVAFPS
jgi:hypothetical protein